MRKLREKAKINGVFQDEHVLSASHDLIPWFSDFANYLASDLVPLELYIHQRKKFLRDVKKFFWGEPYLCRSCAEGIIHRGVGG